MSLGSRICSRCPYFWGRCLYLSVPRFLLSESHRPKNLGAKAQERHLLAKPWASSPLGFFLPESSPRAPDTHSVNLWVIHAHEGREVDPPGSCCPCCLACSGVGGFDFPTSTLQPCTQRSPSSSLTAESRPLSGFVRKLLRPRLFPRSSDNMEKSRDCSACKASKIYSLLLYR